MKILKDIFWTTTKITTHDFKRQHYRSTKRVDRGPCEFTIEMPVHAVTYTCPILPEIASRLLDDDPMELESRDLDGNMVDKKRRN